MAKVFMMKELSSLCGCRTYFFLPPSPSSKKGGVLCLCWAMVGCVFACCPFFYRKVKTIAVIGAFGGEIIFWGEGKTIFIRLTT